MVIRADPYQPMTIRPGLALGPSCPGCFLPYKYVHRTIFLNNSIGGYRVGLYELAQQPHAPQRGFSSPWSCFRTSRVLPPCILSVRSGNFRISAIFMTSRLPSLFNALTSAHILAVVSSGVGGSELWIHCPSRTSHRSKPLLLLQAASFSTARRCLSSFRRWVATVILNIPSVRMRLQASLDSASIAVTLHSVKLIVYRTAYQFRTSLWTYVPGGDPYLSGH